MLSLRIVASLLASLFKGVETNEDLLFKLERNLKFGI